MGDGSLGPSLIVCPASWCVTTGVPRFTAKFAPSFNAVVVAGTT